MIYVLVVVERNIRIVAEEKLKHINGGVELLLHAYFII